MTETTLAIGDKARTNFPAPGWQTGEVEGADDDGNVRVRWSGDDTTLLEPDEARKATLRHTHTQIRTKQHGGCKRGKQQPPPKSQEADPYACLPF